MDDPKEPGIRCTREILQTPLPIPTINSSYEVGKCRLAHVFDGILVMVALIFSVFFAYVVYNSGSLYARSTLYVCVRCESR